MKKAKEYLSGATGDLFLEKYVIQYIQQAQKDAIEATLILAAERADITIEYDSVREGESNGYSDDNIWIRDQDGSGCNLYADKDSILSLKDELFKQIEDEDTK